jgi:hypothetical protein
MARCPVLSSLSLQNGFVRADHAGSTSFRATPHALSEHRDLVHRAAPHRVQGLLTMTAASVALDTLFMLTRLPVRPTLAKTVPVRILSKSASDNAEIAVSQRSSFGGNGKKYVQG